jgi:hypothetical protein
MLIKHLKTIYFLVLWNKEHHWYLFTIVFFSFQALICASRTERTSVTEYEPDQDDAELERVAALRNASIGTASVAPSVIQVSI